MGCTWVSAKWPHLAPPDRDRWCVARWDGAGDDAALSLDDGGLVRAVSTDLAEMMGLREEPWAWRAFRWARALPQYRVGHLERVERTRASLPPRLALAGVAYGGAGIPDCIRQGAEAARRGFCSGAVRRLLQRCRSTTCPPGLPVGDHLRESITYLWAAGSERRLVRRLSVPGGTAGSRPDADVGCLGNTVTIPDLRRSATHSGRDWGRQARAGPRERKVWNRPRRPACRKGGCRGPASTHLAPRTANQDRVKTLIQSRRHSPVRRRSGQLSAFRCDATGSSSSRSLSVSDTCSSSPSSST